jgi:predicted amidohydrolase
MEIKGKKILIFPEYHLTDFPPQVPFTKEDAYQTLAEYKKFGFDILISGYVETETNESFSSCLVIDGEEIHNVRKTQVHENE